MLENDLLPSPLLTKEMTLCTVTFVYSVKGALNGKAPKTDTVFAWITEGCTNKDCVKPLFNPAGVNKGMCIIHEIVVQPIPVVRPPLTPEGG